MTRTGSCDPTSWKASATLNVSSKLGGSNVPAGEARVWFFKFAEQGGSVIVARLLAAGLAVGACGSDVGYWIAVVRSVDFR